MHGGSCKTAVELAEAACVAGQECRARQAPELRMHAARMTLSSDPYSAIHGTSHVCDVLSMNGTVQHSCSAAN